MNAIVPFPTAAEKTLGEQFRMFRSLPEGQMFGADREQAFAAFAAAGLPHRRIEAWHYTDLRSLLRDGLPPAAAPTAATVAKAKIFIASLPLAPGGRAILLDGAFSAELSSLATLDEGISVSPVFEAFGAGPLPSDVSASERLGGAESVVSLNAAFVQGGIVLDVAAGTKSAQPIEILSIGSGAIPAALYTRSYLRLGEGASASVVERHAALEGVRCQANHVLVMSIGDGASLDHVAKITSLGTDTLHIGSLLARLGSDASLLSSTLIATGGVTRRQVFLEFAGPRSKAYFRGVSLLDGRCHADTTLVITHTAPHCVSRELYKHVLDGESTGVYQGKVVVAPGAQKTDGKMLSKAVFLDEGSAMYNKPELEIFADDVACGHGATVGALDDDQLFYLRARGIPLKEAEALLLEAFADEAIEDVADEQLRAELSDDVSRWLRQRGT